MNSVRTVRQMYRFMRTLLVVKWTSVYVVRPCHVGSYFPSLFCVILLIKIPERLRLMVGLLLIYFSPKQKDVYLDELCTRLWRFRSK